MPKLVCVRHGQSLWNKQNRFTGWTDIELSDEGRKEAKKAGELLKGFSFFKVYTSVLKRAIETAEIILQETGQTDLELIKNQALNERHYGDLQGKNKEEVGEEVGAEQLHLWRRGYDTPPPNGESLKDTQERVIPYYREHIEPLLKAGKDILISAHGNSLRALTMYLEDIDTDEISDLNIPTGKPYVYEMNNNLEIKEKKYLGE